MKLARAKTSWFTETGARLDASYHLSEGRQAKISIDNCPTGYSTLSQVTTGLFSGPRFRRHYVENKEFGTPFLGGADTQKAEFNSDKFISNKLTRCLPDLMVGRGWTLLTRSGTIGLTSYTNDDFLDKAITEDVIRVVPNEEEVPSGFLYAFLSSRQGYALLTQSTYGGVIQHIEPHHIMDLPVPLLPSDEQQKIHAQIEESARLRGEANQLLAKAVGELEMLLPPLEFKNQYVAKSSVFISQRLRFDATVQLSAYSDYLEKASQSAKLKTVLSISKEVFTPNIFKRIRVENAANGVPFLSGTNLLESQPKFNNFLSRKMPKIDDYLLRNGWLALQDSGSLSSMGYVSLIHEFLDGAAATNNLIRVVPNDDDNHNPYLLAYFKTKQGQQILKSLSYGTGQLHIDNAQIAQLSVPIYQQVFESVTENVLAYSEHFNKAYELENAAIAHVEQTIDSWSK